MPTTCPTRSACPARTLRAATGMEINAATDFPAGLTTPSLADLVVDLED
jgi:hypothetical protein